MEKFLAVLAAISIIILMVCFLIYCITGEFVTWSPFCIFFELVSIGGYNYLKKQRNKY